MTTVPSTAQTDPEDGTGPCGAPPVDVLFLFDTTGSMGAEISDAQDGATQVMNNVLAASPDTRFGVAHYEDYPGSYSYPGYSTTYGASDNVPWALVEPLTTDTSAVQTGIDGLSAYAGADYPESVSRAVHESRHLSWRTDSIRIVVQFGDAPPHDLDFDGQNTGGDPGPDATAQTADDLDFETEVAQAAGDDIRFVTINSGGSAAEAWFRHLADETDGRYAELQGDFVQQVTDLILGFLPNPHLGARGVAARAQLSVPANPVVEVVPTRVGPGPGLDQGRLAHADLGGAGWVTAAETGANGTRAPDRIAARGNATVANVSLLGGAVRARGLHSVAEATTVSGNTSIGTSVQAADLWVGSEHFEGDVPPNTVVPIPGVGTAILHERHVDRTGDEAGEALVNAIHVVADNAQVRGDVVVSRAYAGSSCDPAIGALLETRDNDAGSGGDAPDSAGSAHQLTDPALVQGRLQAGDGVDFYAVQVEPGEKIEAAMTPSSRAKTAAQPMPGVPSTSARLPDFDLHLREPGTFAVRESSTLPASSPDRVELNVDRPGWWVLEVRKSSGDGNYTLGAGVTPVPLLPQRDALVAGDAPDTCRGARPIGQGVHPGVLTGDDPSDWFAIDAAIGDDLAFALKPTEDADGADFDLFVHDGGCDLIGSSTLGKGLVPKGTPDVVGPMPAPATQTYHVEVRRVNGIGNYHLTTIAQDPHPAVPPLDAESGGDAGASQGGAQPIADPSVNQGAFPDGDDEDWYRFPAAAGDRIDATLTPGALSDLDLHLVRPDGTVQTSSTLGPSLPESVSHVAQDGGTWYLRIVRDTGGGDYTFTLATSPQP